MRKNNPMIQLISKLSAIPMRKEPSDHSEMISQILYGESMDQLDEVDNWLLVKMHHDQYEGWVDRKQVQPFLDTDNKDRFLVKDLFTSNGSDPSKCFVPAGAYSDQSVMADEKAQEQSVGLERNVLHFASMFLETPYLWGGRTFMGIDCSGFTQIVFRLMGIGLLRDAYQQAQQGDLVTFIEESKTGDLAFFENKEGKIVHVGIIIREQNSTTSIIHASGKVRLDKLDHMGIFNNELKIYTHSLRLIKRHL